MNTPLRAEQALAWLSEGMIAPAPGTDPRDGAATPELERRAKEMRAAFLAYPGALQTVLEISLFQPPVNHRLSGEDYLRFAQLREGQNQTAAGILAYIALAADIERNPRGHRNEHTGADSAGDFDDTGPGVAVR